MYSDTDTVTSVYIAGDSIPKVKTAKYFGTLLVTKGGNDVNFAEGRIVISKRCIYGFISLECRIALINPLSRT